MFRLQVATNDVSTKPVKVNKWDTNAVKIALDDASKKVELTMEIINLSVITFNIVVFQRDSQLH
jgi:hypothetical protein